MSMKEHVMFAYNTIKYDYRKQYFIGMKLVQRVPHISYLPISFYF